MVHSLLTSATRRPTPCSPHTYGPQGRRRLPASRRSAPSEGRVGTRRSRNEGRRPRRPATWSDQEIIAALREWTSRLAARRTRASGSSAARTARIPLRTPPLRNLGASPRAGRPKIQPAPPRPLLGGRRNRGRAPWVGETQRASGEEQWTGLAHNRHTHVRAAWLSTTAPLMLP